MRVAYARVSSAEQSLDLQIDALKKVGYDRLLTDHGVSGMTMERDGISEVFRVLKKGDTLIVWRLDRLARSMRELTDTIWSLHHRGIRFQSICEHIDVSSAFGELILHILSSVAHFERALIIERTQAGIQAAKDRGVVFGRKPALDGEQLLEALYLNRRGMKVKDIAVQLGVGRSTLYRYFANYRNLSAQSSA